MIRQYCRRRLDLFAAEKDGMPYFLPPGSMTPAGRRLPQRRAPNLQLRAE